MPAKVGEEAEVPPASLGAPLNQTRKRSPCAATSGMPYGLSDAEFSEDNGLLLFLV